MEQKTEKDDSGVPGVQTKGTAAVFDNVSQSGIKKLCQQAPVIDADTAQIEALLAQGREYQRTGNKRVFVSRIQVAS